jgi:hypothetical protein
VGIVLDPEGARGVSPDGGMAEVVVGAGDGAGEGEDQRPTEEA